jgi:hypothetical protein
VSAASAVAAVVMASISVCSSGRRKASLPKLVTNDARHPLAVVWQPSTLVRRAVSAISSEASPLAFWR